MDDFSYKWLLLLTGLVVLHKLDFFLGSRLELAQAAGTHELETTTDTIQDGNDIQTAQTAERRRVHNRPVVI